MWKRAFTSFPARLRLRSVHTEATDAYLLNERINGVVAVSKWTFVSVQFVGVPEKDGICWGVKEGCEGHLLVLRL